MMEDAREEPIANSGLKGQGSYRLVLAPVRTGTPSFDVLEAAGRKVVVFGWSALIRQR